MKTVRCPENIIPRICYTTIVMSLVLFFIGCAEVPITQRKGLRLVPQSELLSTHPAPAKRQDNLKTYIPEALPYYKKQLK